MNPNDSISLFELNRSIQLELKSRFDYAYWVVAEINEHTVNYSGHCYLELIEKDSATDKIIAKARATIWAGTYRKLLPYFETSAQHVFGTGIKVMVRVTVEFHELYGLSLNVMDIDPAYTVGDLHQQKQMAIEKLKAEGVFHMNKELELPDVIQKIAIISSKTAAGLGDFMNQLDNNSFGYIFYYKLFSAVMQGEQAEQSIINALERIYEYEDFFDVVIIIRGGGSKTDLSCFDKYWLAYHVTQFPLPVLTGIGHEQDDTITDMVAHSRLKTPTAVASFIIDKARAFEENLENLFFTMNDHISESLSIQKQKLLQHSASLNSHVKLSLTKNKEMLKSLTKQTGIASGQYFKKKQKSVDTLVYNTQHIAKNKMNMHYALLQHYGANTTFRVKNFIKNKAKTIDNLHRLKDAFDPQKVLNRGYSITFVNGKLVTQNTDVKTGDEIQSQLKSGRIISKVIK